MNVANKNEKISESEAAARFVQFVIAATEEFWPTVHSSLNEILRHRSIGDEFFQPPGLNSFITHIISNNAYRQPEYHMITPALSIKNGICSTNLLGLEEGKCLFQPRRLNL
jgi:hypothetical protein